MLLLTNCEKRLVIVIFPHWGFFFCFVILKQSLFVGGEDNVACLLAAQGQGPGIMEVHSKYIIPRCISVGLLTLSTVHASTVRNKQVRRRLLSGCLVEIVHSRFLLSSVLLGTA